MPLSTRPERTLPFDVRFALRYRQAQLGIAEITCLAGEYGFEHEAVYLLLKAVAEMPSVQRDLLNKLIDCVAGIQGADETTNDATRSALRDFVKQNLSRIPSGRTVKGGKIAQISRQGSNAWDARYRALAVKCARDSRSINLIGHSTLVGITAFIQAHFAAGKQFRVFIPDLVTDRTSAICGYTLIPHVTMVRKDFEREAEALIIDDTLHTGRARKCIADHWMAHGLYAEPQFEFFTIRGEAASAV